MLESTQEKAPFTTDEFETAVSTLSKLQTGLQKIIKGRDDTINLVLTALAADGHILLEDYPGSGKTTLTKALGGLIGKDTHEQVSGDFHAFRRIQFTPDMLPGDVLGVSIFDPQAGSFSFKRGPVFSHIVLADEINRTGPKVQAAFLECMAEKQVTIDSETHPLDDFFFVVGTQNPLDLAGTYPLPLVQLDRFLLKIPMQYVDSATELSILETHQEITNSAKTLSPVSTRSDILHIRQIAKDVYVHPRLRKTIVDIMKATRESPLLQFGASTRAALMLQQALKAKALVDGRDHVNEDDLKLITPFVLGHRLRFHGSARNQRELLDELLLPHMESLVSAGL